MDRVKPQKLRKNDEIRIIAPSSMPPMKELSEGIEILKKMGYRVSLGKNLKKHSYVSEFSAPVEERLEDLHQAFKDDVKAIFCAKGGHGTCFHRVFLLDHKEPFATTNAMVQRSYAAQRPHHQA